MRKAYRNFLKHIEHIPARMERFKLFASEWYEIIRKRSLYKTVKWSADQTKEFNAYWKTVYGKKISNRWHRLYESINGEYRKDYFPDILYFKLIESKLNDYVYRKVLSDKALIEPLCADEFTTVPDTVAVCSNGVFYNSKRDVISETEFKRCILEYDTDVVVKPTVGSSSGHGIFFLSKDKTEEWQDFDFLKELGKDYIVQRKIVAHPMFSAFNETSINTIRIITYVLNGQLYHGPIAFRIGRKDKAVDNIHSGGLVIGVNDDGTLLEKAYELGYADKAITYTKHPDSGIVFKDYTLPGIQQIIDSAHRCHGKMLHLGVISWDYTMNENGKPVLIEANTSGQSVWFPQMVHGASMFGENTADLIRYAKERDSK